MFSISVTSHLLFTLVAVNNEYHIKPLVNIHTCLHISKFTNLLLISISLWSTPFLIAITSYPQCMSQRLFTSFTSIIYLTAHGLLWYYLSYHILLFFQCLLLFLPAAYLSCNFTHCTAFCSPFILWYSISILQTEG